MPSIFFSLTSSAIRSMSLRLVDLVRDLRDDDRLLVAAGGLLDHRPRRAPGRCRGRSCRRPGCPAAPWMKPPVGKSGPGQLPHELAERRVGVLDQLDRRVDDLGEVVRRDVRRHADRDAGRAVDEEVRELRRQDHRLDERAVVVRRPVDRLLVDVVAEELRGELREPDLGVAHGRGVVAVDRAEVALAVDERVAQREVLRHAHDRVVDRRSRRAGGTCRGRRRRCGRTSGTACCAGCPAPTCRRGTRRWTGFRPSRTSGSARPMMTDIA